ncbi:MULTISPECIES: glycosyltransferase family 4 protein [Pseudomonadota]|nr:glycosyltransferase family 4 protein [Sphingomonas sp. TF3]
MLNGAKQPRDLNGPRKITVMSNAANTLIRFRGHLLELLVRRGHDVHVLAPEYNTEQAKHLKDMGVTTHTYHIDRAGQNPLSDLRTLRDLTRWFRRERPDVSLTFFIKPNIYGGLAAALARVSRRIGMVEGLGYLFISSGPDGLAKRASRTLAISLLRASFARAHRVIFLNPDDRAEFVERRIVAQDCTMLLGGIGVDLDEFVDTPVPAGPPSFLLIARMLREKGVLEFVEAAGVLKREFTDARFRLVGGLDPSPGGISADQMRAFAATGSVEWSGELPDVRPAIAEARVYVLPSYREGVPRSTQEAMAMGRAVVTSDVPGCRETVVPGVNGFFVAPRDAQSLVDAMRRFCTDPDLAVSMGRESRLIAEARFDVKKVDERLYATLMGDDQA